MVVYEIIGGLVVLVCVLLGVKWLSEHFNTNKKTKR